MPTTKNLGLYVADDDTFKTDNPTVGDWRRRINNEGEGTEASPYSDYQILDSAVGQIVESMSKLEEALKSINGEEEETTDGE